MKALLLTNEYPPTIYGGAGVHVEYLVRELKKLLSVDVRSFGDQDLQERTLRVKGFDVPEGVLDGAPDKLKSPLGALLRNISWNATPIDADIVHCHTWYAHLGGVLAKLLYEIPLVVTTHSLEPLRPWKKEQIGTGYNLSSWIEKTTLEYSDAIIAVSEDTRKDILSFFDVQPEKISVIPNGIDIDEYNYTSNKGVLSKYKIPEDKPYVLFVGRITRQKGIIHLLHAISYLDPHISVVLCAGAPDTKEIAEEMEIGYRQAKQNRNNIFWIPEMLSRHELIQFYSHAHVFCCPSIYEPFGIINLEAMACQTPVVGSNVGGIKEIVVPEKTGKLVPFEQKKKAPFEAVHPDLYAKDLADAINFLVNNEKIRHQYGVAGRRRVEEKYSWGSVAQEVHLTYLKILENFKSKTSDRTAINIDC